MRSPRKVPGCERRERQAEGHSHCLIDRHGVWWMMNYPASKQQDSATQEVLAGLVERVTFHNAENGFCVLRVKARGHRDLVTVVGHAATICNGEWVTASGEPPYGSKGDDPCPPLIQLNNNPIR